MEHNPRALATQPAGASSWQVMVGICVYRQVVVDSGGFPPDIHLPLVFANRTLSFLQVSSPLGGDLIPSSVGNRESPNTALLFP